MAGANMIIGVDINPDREEWGRKFGMTHFVNPKEIADDIVAHLVALTDGGADYTFDCTGNTTVMRQALEACHRGWGTSIIIGVADARSEEHTSELQSLMRNPYAVFCLKKKKDKETRKCNHKTTKTKVEQSH